MVLANSGKYIISSFGGEIPENTSRSTIIETLTVTNSGKWDTDNVGMAFHIPMWGIVENITINNSTNLTHASGSDIKLSRMIAKIDIHVGNEAQKNFKLKSIRLYNRNTSGRIIPDLSKWNASTERVTDVSLPANPGKPSNPLTDYLDYSLTTADIACLNEIYTFEARKGVNTTDYTENTCLVIGGEYTEDNTTWKKYFYRVDFANNKDGSISYLDLLRNHRYDVIVNSVSGPGYEDEEEAFKAHPVHIETSIIDWVNAEMEDVWFDGQYYYSVSPLEVNFWVNELKDNQLKIRIDYPTWSYTVTDSETEGNKVDWLKVTSHEENKKYTGSLSGNYLVYDVTHNDSNTSRTAYIHITAGRFTMHVKIQQYAWYIDKIYISPTGIIPAKGDIRTVTIEGYFDDTQVRAWNVTDDCFITGSTVSADPVSANTTLSIPLLWNPYDITQPRDIIVAFEYFNSNQWKLIRSEEQESYYITFTCSHIDGKEIDSDGETYTVNVWGYYPDVRFRTWDETAKKQLSIIIFTTATTPQNSPDSKYIQVPANDSGKERMITMQYSIDNGVTWINSSSGLQPIPVIKHIILKSTGRLVALEDVSGTKTWAEAMGIATSYNSKLLTGKDKGTYQNYTYTTTTTSGCGGYYEQSTDRNKWLLANHIELQELATDYNTLKSGATYWSSTEYYIGVVFGATGIIANTGNVSNKDRSNKFYVRCVREP
ncbi:MAG: DUF1566 domain-containing protein [Tannerellaceae bacterium]|nr:DUF1566 domain-containing protein [Tannerellaceae bacterium]